MRVFSIFSTSFPPTRACSKADLLAVLRRLVVPRRRGNRWTLARTMA
ncbi:hypothetical protein [Streptomyces sp. NPDC017095]